MKRLAVIVLLILLAVPASGAFAGGGSRHMLQMMHSQHALRKWERQQADFWNKFHADMAGSEKQLDAAFPESGKGSKRAISAWNSWD